MCTVFTFCAIHVNSVNTCAMMGAMEPRPYHHGDLREALLAAGVEAAARGGSSALALRELARTVGVSPAAAYRHFEDMDHLLSAVSQRAREALARAMLEALGATPDDASPKAAWWRLHAIGEAYIRFGIAEPHLFETAFTPCVPAMRPDDPAAWDILAGALDELVGLGEIDAGQRATAPIVAWSAVHGLASIATSGVVPPDAPMDEAIEAVLDGVARALVADGRAVPGRVAAPRVKPPRSPLSPPRSP